MSRNLPGNRNVIATRRLDGKVFLGMTKGANGTLVLPQNYTTITAADDVAVTSTNGDLDLEVYY